MFYNEYNSGVKGDKNVANEKRLRQNSLSREEKEQEMNGSLIFFVGLLVFVVVLSIIGLVAIWRERH